MKAGASIRKMEKFFFGRYDVHIPWILGSKLTETNEYQSRKHLFGTEKKMRHHEVQREYTEIVKDQFEPEIIEVPDQPTGKHISYSPHKPVVRQNALITKVRTVFDASAKPHPLVSSVNECMYTGLPLQSLLWDIMVTRLAVGEYQAGFLIDRNLAKSKSHQIGTSCSSKCTKRPEYTGESQSCLLFKLGISCTIHWFAKHNGRAHEYNQLCS